MRHALLLALLGGACAGDQSAEAPDGPPVDAAVILSYCVVYEAGACTFSSGEWAIGPADPTFPSYTVRMRASPGGEGLTASVRLTTQDSVALVDDVVPLVYDPDAPTPTGLGASLGEFEARFCAAPSSGHGAETTLVVEVRDGAGGLYTQRTDLLTVRCLGDTCGTVCPGP